MVQSSEEWERCLPAGWKLTAETEQRYIYRNQFAGHFTHNWLNDETELRERWGRGGMRELGWESECVYTGTYDVCDVILNVFYPFTEWLVCKKWKK